MEEDHWEDFIPEEPSEGYDPGDIDEEEIDEFRHRLKESEDLDSEAGVFDVPTLKALFRLVHQGAISAIGKPLSTGKESDVFLGDTPSGGSAALKIYRINTSSFKDMEFYLKADPRFEGIRGDKKKTVFTWVKKEYSNLEITRNAGVKAPRPLALERNILVQEFIGENEERAPQIREVELDNPETALEVIKEYMRRLYRNGLVHGDLSEYNILVHRGDLYLIDMGQAVTVEHPSMEDLLESDAENIAKFFNRKEASTSPDEILEYIKS